VGTRESTSEPGPRAGKPVRKRHVARIGSAPGGTRVEILKAAAKAFRKLGYHGATVEFDFKDAPIHDLLRIIADTGGVNIVIPESIDPKVTVRLKRVPWDQALEVILASQGLWYRRDTAPTSDIVLEGVLGVGVPF